MFYAKKKKKKTNKNQNCGVRDKKQVKPQPYHKGGESLLSFVEASATPNQPRPVTFNVIKFRRLGTPEETKTHVLNHILV